MKTRKTLISALAILATLGLAFTSCNKENFDIHAGDGYPVKSISFTASFPLDEATIATKASDEVETTVENLAFILIPKASGATAKVFKVNDYEYVSRGSSTNYNYKATVDVSSDPEILGGDYYLYAVANYDKKFISVDIDGIAGKTKAEIDALIVNKGNHDRDIAETSLLMTGKYGNADDADGSVHLIGYNPSEGTSGVNELSEKIRLRRLVAKITFQFVSGTGGTFTPKTYGIYNYSRSESLMERNGWNESDPGSLTYLGSSAESALASEEGLSIKDNTFFFYMPENVQTVYPETPATWTYGCRDLRSYSASVPYGDFMYAPSKATYVVVKGLYESAQYSGEVTYTIHLGDFALGSNASTTGSLNNFSVRRNYKYNYKITVNGVNSIITECTTSAEGEEYSDPNPGAEGHIVAATDAVVVNLDSHFEQVLISFDKGEVNQYSLIVKTPYTDGAIIDDNGDNVTALTPEIEWVRFGAPASSTTIAAYSESSTVDVYELFEEIESITTTTTVAPTGAHYLIDDNKVYIVAYVDEYFYDGKDLSTFINADNRIMTLAFKSVTPSRDQQSTFVDGVVFSLSQKSIKSVENLESSNPFGIEVTEETTPLTTAFADPGNGSSLSDGWANFDTQIRANGITYGSTEWSSVVNIATNGYIGNTYGESIMPTSWDAGYYQCLTRNRDENGDGVIDQDEIKWYLPSVDQLVTLYFGESNLTSAAQLYQSSWEGDSSQCAFYFSSSSGAKRILWSRQGTAFSSYNTSSTADFENLYHGWSSHVRCARSLKDYSAESTTISSSNGRIITVGGLDNKSIRTAYMSGEYPSHKNRGETASPDILPASFEVASGDLTISQTVIVPDTGVQLLKLSDITSMAVGATKTVLMGNPHKNNGYFFGHSGSAAVSSGTGFSTVAAMEEAAEGLISNENYHITLTRKTETTYTISVNGYNPYATSATTATWSTTLMEYTLTDATTVALASVSDMTSDYSTDYLIRFTTTFSSYLNAGGGLSSMKYAAGKGEWSIWHVYELTDGEGSSEQTTYTTEFLNSDVMSGNDFCARNYSESGSDLGEWRVPNEKEFYLMWKNGYLENTTNTNYLSRTGFYSSVFGYNGKYGNITTDISDNDYSVKQGHIRCVRDVKNTTPDSSYTVGGTGAEF